MTMTTHISTQGNATLVNRLSVTCNPDLRRWRHFLDSHPDSNIYHTPEMTDAYTLAEGHQSSVWAAVDQDGDMVALFNPVRVSLYDGPLAALTTRAIAYGGVLCAPGPIGQQALELLLTAYNSAVDSAVVFTELRNQSDQGELQPQFNRAGYAYEDHLNYLIDLDLPEESLFRKLSKSGRRNVRLAARRNVVIKEVTEISAVSTAYDVLTLVYERIRVPLPNLALFEAAFELLYPQEMIKVYLATVDDHPIGVDFLFPYKDSIVSWYGGANHEFYKYRPNDALIWSHFQWGHAHNYRVFDFGGAGKPNEEYGVRDFKAKFGGELVNFGRNTCIHSSNRYKLSQTGYRFVRRLLF